MKNMKYYKTLLILLIVCINTQAFAQTFDLPENVVLNVAEDYPKYNDDMIKAAEWLEKTDFDKETEKRLKVNAFVIAWVSGSPTISIEMNESIMKLVGENADFLPVFFASYSKNYLQNKNTATKFSATKAGLESMLSVYNRKVGVKKNKHMDRLAKMYAKGKIDQYMEEM
jgi:hypothetical protein